MELMKDKDDNSEGSNSEQSDNDFEVLNDFLYNFKMEMEQLLPRN
jgi:hypothetical protein